MYTGRLTIGESYREAVGGVSFRVGEYGVSREGTSLSEKTNFLAPPPTFSDAAVRDAGSGLALSSAEHVFLCRGVFLHGYPVFERPFQDGETGVGRRLHAGWL